MLIMWGKKKDEATLKVNGLSIERRMEWESRETKKEYCFQKAFSLKGEKKICMHRNLYIKEKVPPETVT